MRWSVVALVLLLMLPSPVSAQDEAEGMTLWFHVGASNAMFMTADKEDPSRAAETRYRNFLTWASATQTVTDTIASREEIASDLPFIPDAPIVMSLTVGTTVGWGAAWGGFTVRSELLLDGQVIANGAGQRVDFPAGTNAYFKTLTWSVVPTVPALPAGGALTWRLTATGASSDYVLSASDARGHSHMFLPVVLPKPAAEAPALPLWLEGFPLQFNRTFEEPFTGDATYQWNATAGPLDIALSVLADAGSANLTVLGPDNATLLVFDNGTATLQAVNATGLWTLHFAFTEFLGRIDLRVDAAVAAPTDEDVQEAAPGETVADADEPPKAKDSPGLSLVVAGLLLLALARRRS